MDQWVVAIYFFLSNLCSVSRYVGVHKAVENKKRFAKVIRRQAESPDIMILSFILRLYNSFLRLASISHRRTIKPRDILNPMIRKRHWKWSGSKTRGLWLKLSKSTPASPFLHKSSKWSSASHSKLPQSSSNDLTVKPACRKQIFSLKSIQYFAPMNIWLVDNGAGA